MEKKMKAWQKGYELDTLIEWTNKFEEYNKFCHSPFAKAKKNGMASSLSENKLFEKDNVVYEIRTANVASARRIDQIYRRVAKSMGNGGNR